MPMLTNLADVCRAAGLDVEEVPGWKTRGHTALGPMEKPTGILVHHTAGPKGGSSDYPSRNAILNGWPSLPGPLSQLGLARSGKVIVFAAGVSYHAGPTKDRRFRNVRCIGIEAEHPGDSTPWPPAQYAAYVRLVAALCKGYGLTVADVQGHKEQTAGKIDPTFSMTRFRADVTAALAAPATKPPAVTPAKPAKWVPLDVDGILGKATITAWQQYYGTPADGDITPKHSLLMDKVQADLNRVHGLNLTSGQLDLPTEQALAWHYKTTATRSGWVKALQTALNKWGVKR